MFESETKGERQRATVLMSNDPELRALQDQNGFADAVIIGDDVILSGVITEVRSSDADEAAAYTRTFEAIGETLRRAGTSWDDVVEINSFHTDVNAQLPAFVAVKNRFMRLPHPAWTAIGIAELIGGSGITETQVTAKLDIGLTE